MRKCVVFFSLFFLCLVMVGSLFVVSAGDYGNGSLLGSDSVLYANQILGVQLTTNFPSTDVNLTSFRLYFHIAPATNIGIKFLLINATDKTIIKDMGTFFMWHVIGWQQFNFADSTTQLENNTSYVMGLISNGTVYVADSTSNTGFWDSSNNYVSPSDPVDGISSGTIFALIYSTVLSGGSYTPPPSSTAPVNSPFSGIDLASVDWAGVVSWIAVIILMIIPTFVLGVLLRGGKWGFLIGLSIGTGLSYVIFPNVMQLWLVVLVAVGVAAGFYNSMRSG
jgi:hypothetical protein